MPHFDPGAFDTLLLQAGERHNRGLWAVLPTKAASVEPVQLATYADGQGTLDGKPIAVQHWSPLLPESDQTSFPVPIIACFRPNSPIRASHLSAMASS